MTVKLNKTLSLVCVALLTMLLGPQSVDARGGSGSPAALQRYVIELQDPPLAAYDGRQLSVLRRNKDKRLVPTAIHHTGKRKLNVHSPEARAYLGFITERHEDFNHEASRLLQRAIAPIHQYRLATNGVAVDLSEEDAALLAKSPLVKSISKDRIRRLETFAGPEWIGAGQIWSGGSGFSASEGENIIVGVLDSGINWDSPSFDDPTIGGYAHTNPLGATLGLCNLPEVRCNNKLIGVYDYVSDVPTTEDVEENTNGKDIGGHGSHVASIAVGNPVNIPVPDRGNQTLSGVAPKANLITYRICHTNNCFDSFTIAAIDQAIEDGVDVLNYSIGGDATNPWFSGTIERAFLNARGAGVIVVTSAGNAGPDDSSIGSPANAPWIVGVGYATHNVGDGSVLQNLVGGNTTPPGDITGASLTGGTGQRVIVHARDYGFALCGSGETELQPTCTGNQGQSNPWQGEKPFNGQIVVCDRGTYGRVEKGKNVLLAGAGGYILANTADFGEALVTDNHCLPASHIGERDGDNLREWLASGSGHGGAISDPHFVEADRFADHIQLTSSRGPGLPPVEDVLKPNLIAPGYRIFAATENGQQYTYLSGTSMASPHVAGAGALVKSVHPDWTVSQVISAIETTANRDLAMDDYDGDAATAHEQGAGRPQLGEAVNTGLYLDVTVNEFVLANPAAGGEPGNLNMAGLVDASCRGNCSFTRKVTDHMGGGNWNATPLDFPVGVTATVTPANFTLGNGSTRELEIAIDLGGVPDIGEWVDGRIRLSAAGSSDQYLTVAVKSHVGVLPESWTINDNRNGGWHGFSLSNLTSLPDATFTSGGLVRPDQTTELLVEDLTWDDPYDGGEGVFTTWHDLPQGGLWLHTETLASTAGDLDLYVGRDDNDNGIAEPWEELCNSALEGDTEQCDLYDLSPGSYWSLVQNWEGFEVGGDEVTLLHAAIASSADGNLAVSGPGITNAGDTIPLRVSWDNLDALPGEQFLGAVGVGASRNTPNSIGVIPLRFNRNGIAGTETFPLVNGTTHRLAINASESHDRLFIDVPPGTSRMTIFTNGAEAAQNNGLTMELKRLDFDEAFSEPPFAAPAGDAPTIVSAQGVGGVGPSITVVGVEAGRWYPVLTNDNDSPIAVEIRADVEFQGSPIAARPGLWQPGSRPGLGQGYEYNQGGPSRVLIWYSYDEAGQPTWYIAGNPVAAGNIWTADLRRFTNDGTDQQSAPVGQVSISSLAEDDAMFSYTLFGQSGTDRMQPISALTCPQIGGSAKSYTGVWFRGVDGLGGASLLVNANTQSQIHYLFDDSGRPRWLYAQDLVEPEPTNNELPMFQFSGYCAVCEASSVSSVTVGALERSFDSESTGSWTLDYLFKSPLSGSVNRTDQISKLTDEMDCQ
jgi:subtilisin family serine protease